MKRYFFTATRPGATHVDSEYNYLTLPGGAGHLVCMFEESAAPDPAWVELAHLLDAAPLSAHPQAAVITSAIAGFAGIAATDQTHQLAVKLSVHNPRFRP